MPLRYLDPTSLFSIHKWIFSEDLDTEEVVYQDALEQADRSMKLGAQNLAVNLGIGLHATCSVAGPILKRLIPQAVLPRGTGGNSNYTRDAGLIFLKARNGLARSCVAFLKKQSGPDDMPTFCRATGQLVVYTAIIVLISVKTAHQTLSDSNAVKFRREWYVIVDRCAGHALWMKLERAF